METKRENFLILKLRKFWRYINSTVQRKVFSFCLFAIVLLLLFNIVFESDFVFIASIILGMIAILASWSQTLQNRNLFTKEIEVMRKDLKSTRYMENEVEDNDAEDEDKKKKKKSKDMRPFTEKEQFFIERRLKKYKMSILVHFIFVILLAVLLVQMF